MTPSRKRQPKPPPLQRGDVIKTHPRDGYWGCAVVLTDPRELEGLRPMCHIGITPLLLDHDYTWGEIEGQELSILEFDRGVRIAAGRYGTRHETCIGLYTSDSHHLMPVIGSIDPTKVFARPLRFEVGDGTDGKYPLCGPISPHLGSEAVTSWFRVHDPARWQAERDAARERYEHLAAAIREEERQKRQGRRMRKGGA